MRDRRIPVSIGGWTSARAAIASLALALCLGIGFSSVVSTGLIVIGIAPTSWAFVLADVALWVIVGALGWLTRRVAESPEPKAQGPEPRVESREWLLPAAFGVIAIVALVATIAAAQAAPHGDWDAWAIWNLHARFLFRGGG